MNQIIIEGSFLIDTLKQSYQLPRDRSGSLESNRSDHERIKRLSIMVMVAMGCVAMVYEDEELGLLDQQVVVGHSLRVLPKQRL